MCQCLTRDGLYNDDYTTTTMQKNKKKLRSSTKIRILIICGDFCMFKYNVNVKRTSKNQTPYPINRIFGYLADYDSS